jgi:hypothetical protein
MASRPQPLSRQAAAGRGQHVGYIGCSLWWLLAPGEYSSGQLQGCRMCRLWLSSDRRPGARRRDARRPAQPTAGRVVRPPARPVATLNPQRRGGARAMVTSEEEKKREFVRGQKPQGSTLHAGSRETHLGKRRGCQNKLIRHVLRQQREGVTEHQTPGAKGLRCSQAAHRVSPTHIGWTGQAVHSSCLVVTGKPATRGAPLTCNRRADQQRPGAGAGVRDGGRGAYPGGPGTPGQGVGHAPALSRLELIA